MVEEYKVITIWYVIVDVQLSWPVHEMQR